MFAFQFFGIEPPEYPLPLPLALFVPLDELPPIPLKYGSILEAVPRIVLVRSALI